ncbi:hypothetical protein K469DRAFT_736853 [Zopfia rhizophila CBS 207.26]|uniref:Histone chaperone domain-containing protein n=1 Tax=Zopfia rhizophila CBS 207.26 TaxID=1314779 RepID=A0A6A6EHD5_9PEZI|nr:hypothetical protein K469DRAFT_736853 [Zopfia rhizophila CBS 207.26]
MNANERKYDDKYEAQNDATGGDVPSGVPKDDSYVTRGSQRQVQVQRDDAPVEDPIGDPKIANSDRTLERDDREAIDRSNVLEGRTRGATKKPGTYVEPGDEEGLPGPHDGSSATRK